MGHWKGMRSSSQVQSESPNKYLNFEKVKEIYENTKPIRGKRECLNIRPVGERGRTQDRVIKVSDEEYYLTCNSYAYVSRDKKAQDTHCRAITFIKRYDNETIIIHTPKGSYGTLTPRWLNAPSMLYFYHYKLPNEFGVHNHRGKKYIAHTVDGETKYYTMAKGDIVFLKRQTDSHFRPFEVHREYVRALDKDQTKVANQKIKPFLDYAKTMINLVENEKWTRDNPLSVIPIEQLFKQEPSEWWLDVVENYKHRIRSDSYIRVDGEYKSITEYKTHLLGKKIQNDLYKLVRPFKLIEVELGKVCYDKYANWN
jgi:hypothetical protein